MKYYSLIPNWPDLPEGFILGTPTGIGIDSQQNIFVFHRAGRVWTSMDSTPDTGIPSNTILMLDKTSGKIVNSWGADLFIMPHGLTIDHHNNIWVTDVGAHQIFKFSPAGELLLRLGVARVSGNDSTHFYCPTDIAVATDDSFYVTDGYGNNRVIKFSSTGEYLFEWGKKGDKAGEFKLPHAIDLDEEGMVYVADRQNNRIQVFTPNGEFIRQWTDKSLGRMSSIVFDRKTKGFIAVDYTTSSSDAVLGSEIILFDPLGRLITKLGKEEGEACWYHNILVDEEQNIYITDILRNRVQKFALCPE